MRIDRQLDKADLLGERVWIEEGVSISPRQIARGPRVGIDYAESWIEKPWRFWVRDNPFVSRIKRSEPPAVAGGLNARYHNGRNQDSTNQRQHARAGSTARYCRRF